MERLGALARGSAAPPHRQQRCGASSGRPQRRERPAAGAQAGKGFGEPAQAAPKKEKGPPLGEAGAEGREPQAAGTSYEGLRPFQEQQRRLAEEAGPDFERFILQFLGVLFGVVILEGIVLAASGFLSEEVDDAITKFLYPAYTPTIAVFFLCSASYGVWKSAARKT